VLLTVLDIIERGRKGLDKGLFCPSIFPGFTIKVTRVFKNG